MCLVSVPAPPDNGRRRREEEEKSVPRRRHGRLEAVGAGGSPAPKRSSRPQGCMVAGERAEEKCGSEKRRLFHHWHAYQTEIGWLAGRTGSWRETGAREGKEGEEKKKGAEHEG